MNQISGCVQNQAHHYQALNLWLMMIQSLSKMMTTITKRRKQLFSLMTNIEMNMIDSYCHEFFQSTAVRQSEI